MVRAGMKHIAVVFYMCVAAGPLWYAAKSKQHPCPLSPPLKTIGHTFGQEGSAQYGRYRGGYAVIESSGAGRQCRPAHWSG